MTQSTGRRYRPVETGVPCKMVNAIKALHEGSCAEGEMNGEIGERFTIAAGLSQGYTISPSFTLAYVGVSSKIKRIEHKGFSRGGSGHSQKCNETPPSTFN
eukprot:GHVN01033496.1.p2 GENE.GHVN01033496.1~~GHVN01033496.1.p2  ORF type:complete len:101 (-),score=10.49 GHVN01033496.1:410-712(-)